MLTQTMRVMNAMRGDEMISVQLMAYIADYINEEIQRGATIDKYTITDAVMSFDGGANDDEVEILENRE